VEVPLWLATSLAIKEFVSLELPRVFQHAFRQMLHADPAVVDLQQKCYYFYEFGIKLATLIADPDLGHTLCRSLNTRFVEIVRRTANRKQAESLDFTSRLAHLEKSRQMITQTHTHTATHA
jgi:GINS complex subunit 3